MRAFRTVSPTSRRPKTVNATASQIAEGAAITAKVRGTHPYTATLGALDGQLEHACDCPHAADGNFCKHCVALGLKWLEQEALPPRQKPITRREVRKWLDSRQKKELVELLLDHAKTDERLDRRLTLETAKAIGGAVNTVAFEQALDDALCWDEYVSWHDSYEYGQDIDEVVDSIEDLLVAGHAFEVVGLAETALARVESAMENVDDSDGCMGMIIDRLQALHLKACKQARPDPVALAERLFAGELQTGFDTFYDGETTYANVLGEKGLARHRGSLAETRRRAREAAPRGRGGSVP